jgi:hypothetical protein
VKPTATEPEQRDRPAASLAAGALLRAPPTLLQRQALDAAEAFPVEIDAARVLEVARASTGLEYFGDEGAYARLERWVQAINGDRGLTALGRATLLHLLIRLASSRLRVLDLARRRRELLAEPLEPPIIVAGLPRSGTTQLLHLLAADPRLRSLPWWEAVEPVPCGDEEERLPGVGLRRERAVANWAMQDALLPALKAMHGFDPDHVSEDIELLALDFSSYMLEWLADCPDWRDHYLASDQRGTYGFLRTSLQLLAGLRGPRRWVTKNPQHIEQLAAIADVFPEATVVITHRDPVASVQSAATMMCYTGRIMRRSVDPPAVARYWVDRYRRMLERCVAERDRLSPERSVDLYFDRWIGDQDAALRRIYELAGMPLTADALGGIQAWRAANPPGLHGRLRYDMRRDFDLDPREVRKQFDFYFERFPVAVEVE